MQTEGPLTIFGLKALSSDNTHSDGLCLFFQAAFGADEMTSPRFFMCRPDYFGINYEINPWMNRQVEVIPSKAIKQWESLVSILKDDLHADIDLISPVEDQPDMVFTANAGYIYDKTFIPSRFRFAQRQGEEPHFRHWFENQGYKLIDLKAEGFFEGCGDALPLKIAFLPVIVLDQTSPHIPSWQRF